MDKKAFSNEIYLLLIETANAAKVVVKREVEKYGIVKGGPQDIPCPKMRALAENVVKLDELWEATQ